MRPFAVWHALRRARQRARRRPTTTNAATWVRSQVTLALDLLSFLDDRGKTLATATQADIDAWLDGATEYRYLLGSFINWARARHLCGELAIPRRPRTDPDTFLDEAHRTQLLTRCLHDCDLPLDVRAAGALMLLYGQTASRLAALTTADIRQVGQETYLQFDVTPALLPPPLASLVQALRDTSSRGISFQHSDEQTRLLFPGRFPGRPIAAKVLLRKLRRHGIDPRPARHAARAAWAQDLPAPIAADLLGVSISTATKWATRTRRDWSDYIAARHQQRDGDVSG
ncbi:hypothetical protein [Streptosporangium sp. NPDC087985]|uniref:hypothetical protein n=1 Tax=Streptosporangium sp. NPDC087985 TaxID=3366196 RepID=UPI0037F3D955